MSGKINRSPSVETEIYHWLFVEVPRKPGAKKRTALSGYRNQTKKKTNLQRLLF